MEKQTHKLEGDPESIRQKGMGSPDISESGDQMSLNSNPVAAGQVLLFAHHYRDHQALTTHLCACFHFLQGLHLRRVCGIE